MNHPDAAARPFDALLCDFDGVIRFHDTAEQARLERAFKLGEGATARLALSQELMMPAVLGEITCEEWEASLLPALTKLTRSAERAAQLAAAFIGAGSRADETVCALLEQVRDLVPVVLVTNATTRLEDDLDELGLCCAFDEVVSSARVGVAKPDRRIYEIAAEQAGVPVGRCLFVDDRLANVEAARKVGMQAVHFRRPDDLRKALAPLLDGIAHSSSSS
ncbi:HAD family hydrolase [Planobispora takensis]|uniref:HAD family hydrolase n=1 Tax=Planobispora takensis TaxID=1367882 RepID=UPI00194483DB|nr:HAD-IA family hydrolase [Planobispora takensis]